MGAATLIIGIGGQGGKIVQRIAKRVGETNAPDIEFVVMDTDVNDLDRLHRANARISTVQTSYRSTVGAALDTNREACEGWFPVTPGLLGKSLTEGAGQVRAISRLAFDHAVESGKMRPLEQAIERLRSLRGDRYEQSLRIMICGCLSGGTGSGIALPVAMYVRNFLITRYQDQSSIIRGFFLEPDCLFSVIVDEEERNNQRCNAYAAIREIDAFLRKQYTQEAASEYRHVVFNAPQPGVGRRMNYPNILPYNFVFLMDAMNLDGEHLGSLDEYLDHMADVIYTQSVGTAAARSNSTEDNFTRRLDQSQGRARYCGAGCSHLVYPYDTVRRYFGLRWSAASVSDEWMEIDHVFQREVKEGLSDTGDLERAKSFVGTFDQLRGQSKLYAKIGKDSKVTESVRTESGAVMDREVAIGKEFVRKLKSFAFSWNSNATGLAANCGALDAFLTACEDIDDPMTEPEEIKSYARDYGATWISSLESVFSDYDRASRQYYHLVSSEVAEVSKTFARRLFRTPESDVNPLEMLSDEHFIEHYLAKQDGEGAKHPLVVRYILADAMIALTQELESLEKSRTGKDRLLAAEYDSFESGSSDAGIRRDSPEGLARMGQFFNELRNKTTATDAQAAEAANKGLSLTDLREEIDAYRALVVQCEVLSAALEHVQSIARAYQGFFNYMEGQVPLLLDEARAIEERPDFNGAKGSPTRYVCASKQCLDYMLEVCPQAGSSADLPPELCADIYRGVVRYAAISGEGQSYAERNAASDAAFADLFRRTVVDYWTTRLEDPALGYQAEVDKTVMRAVIDEMRYTEPVKTSDPIVGEALLRGHMLDVMDEAYDLALPYIMKPLEPEGEEKPSTAGFCIYAKGAYEGLGTFAKDAETRIKTLNGTEVEEGEVSRHEMLFFRQIYGFRAAHLPHYACAHEGNESRPAGEYHVAYWDIASHLSPDTKRNRYITPHIDRHWHLISYLPDISDSYQRELYEEIIRAYVYGLTAREFGTSMARDGSSVFYLTTGSVGQKQVELTTDEGGRCDQFYEVFDALKFDPQVVSQLIARSNESLEKETSRLSSARPEFSLLVENIRSKAFGSFAGPAQVLAEIAAYEADKAALAGEYAYDERDRSEFLSRMVSQFFEVSRDSQRTLERIRHSIFEIPVFYRISLPPTAARSGEIEDMLDGIYASIRNYFAHFASDEDLEYTVARFLEEQYLLFECNLPLIEAAFPETAWSTTVTAVREKVVSFFDRFSETGRALSDAQREFSSKWLDVRRSKDALARQRQAEAFAQASTQL